MLFRISIFSILFSFSSPLQPAAFQDSSYTQHTWKSFRNLPQVQEAIDLYNPDYALLEAALFYATNQARTKTGRPPFKFHPKLRDMAVYHAKSMARHHFVSHTNRRDPSMSTMMKRAQRFNAPIRAENVASYFLYQYRSGSYYYKVKNEQGYTFFDANTSQSLPVHSYWSFAEKIVRNWMNSPGHRKNILNSGIRTLGCGVRIGQGELQSGEIPMAYATQNFGY